MNTCAFPHRACRQWRGLRRCGRCALHCETKRGGTCAVPCDGIPANSKRPWEGIKNLHDFGTAMYEMGNAEQAATIQSMIEAIEAFENLVADLARVADDYHKNGLAADPEAVFAARTLQDHGLALAAIAKATGEDK